MKKNKKKNQKYFVIFTILLLIFSLFYIAYSYSKNTSISLISEESFIDFTSRDKQVKFRYPISYELEEKFNDITLKKSNSYILLYHIGTNYTDLKGYLDSLEILNHVKFIDRTSVEINGLKGISTITIDPQTKVFQSYSYFFYPEPWTVYSISSDSKELRNDVDAITKTFVYNP